MYRIRTTPFVESTAGGAPEPRATVSPELLTGQSTPVTKASAWARAAWTSEKMGLNERAKQLYQRALDELKAVTPPSHWELAAPIRNNLASLLRFGGQIAEAEAEYITAINMLDTESAPEASTMKRRLMMNLAALYHDSGHEKQARDLVSMAH